MSQTKLNFKRYEEKYLLSDEKYEAFFSELREYIERDEYYKATVCSIYYDSDDYSLIRHSIDKPLYKEKLRLRSYNVPGPRDKVFVELKKKYKGIVYKRRIMMPAEDAESYLEGKAPASGDSQIEREIDWFLHNNPVKPKVLIACDRKAYRAKENHELRITFDKNLRWRQSELSLQKGSSGQALIPENMQIMEIKIPGAMPLWLADMLSRHQIFPCSFSKYGSCYRDNILEKYLDGVSL